MLDLSCPSYFKVDEFGGKFVKIYGYSESSEDLLSLVEVTIQANPEKLRELSLFLGRCADEMERSPDWEHEHFNNALSTEFGSPDIVVYRS